MSAETALVRAVRLFGRAPPFRGLPRADFERISGLASAREIRAGGFVFRKVQARGAATELSLLVVRKS